MDFKERLAELEIVLASSDLFLMQIKKGSATSPSIMLIAAAPRRCSKS
jgi:hypothetical protein